MSRSSPTTQRFPAVALARESERVMASATPTVKLHSETIRALIEADAERAQSETLRVAVAASEEWETCEYCNVTDPSVDSDPDSESDYEWICAECVTSRLTGKPTRDDYEFDKAGDARGEEYDR